MMVQANPIKSGPSISTAFSTTNVHPDKTASKMLSAVKEKFLLEPNMLKDLDCREGEEGVGVVPMVCQEWLCWLVVVLQGARKQQGQ